MIDSFRKIYALLSRRERRRFFMLLGLVLVMALLEVAGVASILPFLAVLSKPEVVFEHPVLASAYAWGGFTEELDFLIALGIAVFCVIVLNLIFKMLTLYAMTRFGQMRKYTLGLRLLRIYLGQPYHWHLTAHSAHLAKNILSEVDEIVDHAIIPTIRVISFGVIVLFVVALLVVADPVIAVLVPTIIGGCYTIVFFVARRYLLRIGEDRRQANRERFRITQECLGDIKQIKLRGLEREFVSRFDGVAFRLASRRASGDAIGELPKHALEALLIGSILAVVIVKLVLSQGDLQASLPIIGLYAFAGIRLFPAAHTIYQNTARLRLAKPALDALYDDLNKLLQDAAPLPSPGKLDGPRMSLRKTIALEDISYAYPGGERTALDHLSIEVQANTTVAFVGRTGSGKTTLANMVLGLFRPDSGRMLVDGVEVNADNMHSWQAGIGYVPQEIFLTDDTIRSNIAFGLSPDAIDQKAVEKAARLAELHDFVVKELPQGYDTPVGERGVRLSGGERQRIGIARALFHDPDLLIMDEATSALDNVTERAVMDAVQNLSRSKTVILIAHRLSTVRECDELFLIENGEIAARGRYDELRGQSSAFRSMSEIGSS